MSKVDQIKMGALDLLVGISGELTVTKLDICDRPQLYRDLVQLENAGLVDMTIDAMRDIFRVRPTLRGLEVAREHQDLYMPAPTIAESPYEADELYGAF